MEENRDERMPILLVDDETQVLLLYSGMLQFGRDRADRQPG